jgi:spermidine/putrescine transport system permease protein
MAFHANTITRGQKKSWPLNAISAMSVPYLLLLLLLVLLPFFFIVLYAFLQKDQSKLYLTLSNFASFLSEPTFLSAFGLSFLFALITTGVCLIVGYPVAYFIGRSKGKIRNIMVMLITIPMWINMLLRILAWMQIFDIITALTGIKIIGTDFAVIFGMVYDFLPFMIVPIYTSIMKIDPALYEASKDLGANSVKTFFHVTLPLSTPGIISGITMVFLPSATSLVVPTKLGYGNPKYFMIGNLIESYYNKGNNPYLASAIAVVLSITMLLMMYLINKLDRSSVKDGIEKEKHKKRDLSAISAVASEGETNQNRGGSDK